MFVCVYVCLCVCGRKAPCLLTYKCSKFTMETILENHNIYLYTELDHRFPHYYIGQILPNSRTCRPKCALVHACYLQEEKKMPVRICNSRLCIALFLSPFLLHEKVSVAKYFFPLLYFYFY